MKKKKIIILSTATLLSVGLFSIYSPSVYASIFGDGGGQETVQFLNTYNDYLTYGNFFNVFLHQIGWGLVKILYRAVSAVESLIPETFTLLDFLESAGVNSLASAVINDLVVALMVLTIVFIGIKMIIGKEPPQFKNILVNIVVSGLLIVGLPSLMSTMQDMSLKFYEGTQTGSNNNGTTSLAWSLVQDSTADLLYLSEVGFATANSNNVKNNLTPQSLGKTNLTALLTPDLIDEAEGEEIQHLEYKLEQNAQGEDIAVKIDSGALGFFSKNFDEGYFRYDVSFLPIIIGLVALAVAYIFAIFVLITTIIELAIKRVVGYFVFATDLESGQRTKMVVQDIANAFMLIAFTGLSMMFYTQFLSFLSQQTPNIIIYLIAIVSATFVLIKGSNTIMRYFGVDTGVKEGFGQLAGAFAIGRATKGGLGKVGSTIKGVAGAGKKGLSTKQALQDRGENANLMGVQSETAETGAVSKLKNSVNSAGRTAGYLKSRGLTGLTEDTIKGAGERIANQGRTVSDSVKSISDSAREGFNEGFSTGESNKQKWSSRKMASVNEMESSEGKLENNSLERQSDSTNRSINDSQMAQSQGNGASFNQKQRLDQELNSVNTPSPRDEKVRITEEREAKELQNPSVNRKNEDSSVQTTMDRHANQSINQGETQDVVQHTRANTINNPTMQEQEIKQTIRSGQPTERSLNQEVNQETRTASSTNSPLRQEMQDVRTDSHVGMNRQNVASDVQSVTPSTQSVRQNVVQDVQQAQSGSQTVRNNVVQDVQGGMNTNTASTRQNVTQDVKSASHEGQAIRNNVVQDVQPASNGGQTVRNTTVQEVQTQSVSMSQQATQRITQQIEKAGMFGISDHQRQRVIQEVQQHASGSPEMKQKVVQQLEQANIATPAQATQNIEQAMKRVRVPQETQQVVQNVLQEVQTAGNVSTQAMKQKVVQELEKADFGAKEPIKELIIQDVQRAFSATPEQMTQNVKQVIDTVETQNLNSTATHEVNTNVTEERSPSSTNNNKSYFNQLFGEDLTQTEAPVRKGKRFSAIKGL